MREKQLQIIPICSGNQNFKVLSLGADHLSISLFLAVMKIPKGFVGIHFLDHFLISLYSSVGDVTAAFNINKMGFSCNEDVIINGKVSRNIEHVFGTKGLTENFPNIEICRNFLLFTRIS